MNMNSENDDKETLLQTTSQDRMDIKYDKSEPFDIERVSIADTQERPLPIPSFISEQRTLYEKSKIFRIICCCCAKRFNHNVISNIKNKELKAYYKIKSLASQLFDDDNSQHKESLKFLYILCINKEMNGDFRSMEWKRIGFQTDNPTTDFRGSGYISLLFLIYFVKQYESEYNEMINQEYFLFAISAIRLVFLFKIFAHLMETEKDMNILLNTNRVKRMTIKQFKYFTRNLLADENYLYDILAKCLINVKKEYLRQYKEDKKELNFLLIEPIIQSSFEIIYDELDESM